MIGPAPKRLNPFFGFSATLEKELLFSSDAATLEHYGKNYTGSVVIHHHWESSYSRIEFYSRLDPYERHNIRRRDDSGIGNALEFPIAPRSQWLQRRCYHWINH